MQPRRHFSSQAGAAENNTSSAFSKMPEIMKTEVLKCLATLEIILDKSD